MEIWKEIEGWEGKYKISSSGRLLKINKWVKDRVLKSSKGRCGYLRYPMSRNGKTSLFLAHRLVAKAFISMCEDKPQVNHIDCCKTNNSVENLEWCDRFENMKHAQDNGLINYCVGEKHGRSKLKKNDVILIKKMIKRGNTDKEICSMFGVNIKSINNIRNKKNWGHISDPD